MDSPLNDTLSSLDKYLSPTFRHHIEKNYYEKINAHAKIEEAIKDPLFLSHPLKHISCFTDHGLVHVRDITLRMLHLLDQLNGVLFTKRSPARLDFMKGFGAMLAYVHDIGMVNVKSEDHDMHAHAAAHIIFNEYFDAQLSLLWEENSGNVAWRITKLGYKKNVLREMLALASAHAKEVVPVEMLNNPYDLRRTLQEMLAYPLEYQWLNYQYTRAEHQLRAAQHLELKQREKYEKQKQEIEAKLNQFGKPGLNSFLNLYYADFWTDAFQWLGADNTDAKELVEDVIDTLRVLRAANASRQRGAKLRATGEHQIFLDHKSANAIFAINTNQKLFLLESKNTLLAGEVNLSSTEYTQAGDLRISFYRGQFGDDAATTRAVFNAAVAINEVQADMIGSFKNDHADYSKKWQTVFILLENCDDNPDFAHRVNEQLVLLNPSLKNTIRIVPSLQNAPEIERNRYLNAEDLQWDLKTENDMLEKIANSGHKIMTMHAQDAFTHVKCAEISSGEILMQAGTLGVFVYVPLNDGLMGYPLGGYAPFHARPFIPLGNVGVIRGDTRNATVVAENPVNVLMIPREVYLTFWHNTYSEQEFVNALNAKHLT